MPLTLLFLIAVGLAIILRQLHRRLTRISISDLPGPEPESFLTGNLRQYLQSQAGDIDFQWQDTYGDIIRFKGPLGEDRILVIDPKALQYIFRTGGYNFIKPKERRDLSLLISGPGIVWADGQDHRRHRKIMTPAFGTKEAKAHVPLFFHFSSKLSHKWKDIISASDEQAVVFDTMSWLSRATLDAIGAAAFDYQFERLDGKATELGDAYSSFCLHAFGRMSESDIVKQALTSLIPRHIRMLMNKCKPNRRMEVLRSAAAVGKKVAKFLIEEKSEAILEGRKNRDIMSLLIRANYSEDDRTRMSEEEMISQMRTILVAGGESTAMSLTWFLLEMARHPEMQSKLRAEIRQKRHEIEAQGESELTANDMEAMPYLMAVTKETLRFHPVAYTTVREAARDDVLPLSKPVITASGKAITEVPIPKGLKIFTSINGYNRHKDVFGADSHVYDPERWLTPGRIEKCASVGVFDGNLLSFAGGVRSCIGWRFALLELQSFFVELIDKFEFSPTPESLRVRREACMVMSPTIEGQVDKGSQLPLLVKIAA
ncbi:cytochrome P450 [Panaeolus papilionaceus]|nr:cytochrome P450 [Panaeolus papilionaceus]